MAARPQCISCGIWFLGDTASQLWWTIKFRCCASAAYATPYKTMIMNKSEDTSHGIKGYYLIMMLKLFSQ
jgi:hypothetical protein